MKLNFYCLRLIRPVLVVLLALSSNSILAQQAVVSNPMAIGKDCANKDGGHNFKVFNYSSTAKTLTQIGSDCAPSLATPGFSASGGSIAFNPADQKVYYIETTNGNNSIVWNWSPETCPTNSQPPLYTYTGTFIVGLDFNPATGEGYQVEFVGAQPPYSLYLRKVTSFGPPLVAGTSQQIMLPAGVKIYQQNGDIVITPTGQMYFVFNNKMFSLDYSTYGTGTLNATFIDSVRLPAGVNLVGLSYYNGKFIGSGTNNTTNCVYKEIDISTNPITLTDITPPPGAGRKNPFSTLDMSSLITGIGVAKKISSVSLISSNRYSVQYDVKIRSYGNTNLNNVQLTDDMASVFGAAFVSATVSPVGTLPSGLTINSSYDGKTNTNIFVGGVSSTLKVAPADSAIVRVTVVLNNPDLNYTYNSSAKGSAQNSLFAQTVSDLSNNDAGLRADLNFNDVPDDAGENVPTPLLLAGWTVLPNKVIDFNASYINNAVMVHWLLEEHDPGLKVNVQRSINGTDFQNIGSVPVSNSLSHNYEWIDEFPSIINYYRLELVAVSGEKTYTNIVKVSTEKPKAIEISVSPVPFQDFISFSIFLKSDNKIVYRLLDVNTNIIVQGEHIGQAGDNAFKVKDLGRVQKGTYFLQVVAGDQIYHKAVIKVQ